MYALQQFDVEFKKINSYEILGKNVIKYLLTFIGVGLMFIPLFAFDSIVVVMGCLYLLGASTIGHLEILLHTRYNGKYISVYKILSQTSINKKMYIKARLEYLNTYLIKIGIASFIMQMIGVSVDGFSAQKLVYSIIYLLIIFLLLFVIGYSLIELSTR